MRITSITVGLSQRSKNNLSVLLEIQNKITNFTSELFDSIALQIAEIRTVAKSLPLLLGNSANRLFINRLNQSENNLK